MFHFFRRIRQALLSNNKYQKYLLYAIGEIALVMIGILLALQVNNWNEERKRTKNKNEYCQQLIASLRADQVRLNGYQDRLAILEEAGMYLWDYVHGTRTKIDSNLFKNHFLSAANSFEFSPRMNAYDNLVESDGLRLIKNDSLKGRFSWYFQAAGGSDEVIRQRIEYAKAYNDLRFEFASPMMLKKYLFELFQQPNTNFLAADNRGLSIEIGANQIDLSEYTLDWEKLKNSQEFKTYLGRMLAIREPVIDDAKSKILMLEQMIEMLEEEVRG